MKKYGVLFLICGLLLVSCDNGLANEFGKSIEDPKNLGMNVESFNQVNTIFVSWEEDDGADKYVLYRKCENNAEGFIPVYRGTETSYVDKDLITSNTYVYRLDKTRGNKTFTGSKYGFGVASSLTNDAYENNDSINDATELTDSLNANLWTRKFNQEGCDKLYDIDWYKVEVGAFRQAGITVTQENLGSGDTNFYYFTTGTSSVKIKNNTEFKIQNNTNKKAYVYFAIYCDDSELSTNGYIGYSYSAKVSTITMIN